MAAATYYLPDNYNRVCQKRSISA